MTVIHCELLFTELQTSNAMDEIERICERIKNKRRNLEATLARMERDYTPPPCDSDPHDGEPL